MKNFAAIDFETANQQRTSVCSVGIVIVMDGEIVDSYYSLIKPEPEYYSYWNTRVHGLTMEDTMNARVFPEVWAEIEPKIKGLPLVAHNSPFDEGCLKSCSKCIRWSITTMSFIAPVVPPGESWALSYPTTSYIPLPPIVDTTLPCTIMPWLTQRHALGLPGNYYNSSSKVLN